MQALHGSRYCIPSTRFITFDWRAFEQWEFGWRSNDRLMMGGEGLWRRRCRVQEMHLVFGKGFVSRMVSLVPMSVWYPLFDRQILQMHASAIFLWMDGSHAPLEMQRHVIGHACNVFTGVTRWYGEWPVRARLGSESSPGAGVRDSEAELGGADMSRRGKVV